MAILNSIRKRGVFLIVIIAMALFSFVLADVIRNGGFGTDRSQTTIATVNGIDIPRTQFMEDVESYQRALGPNSSQNQAMNVIWDREVRSVLLQEQYESLGMVAEQEWMDESLSLSLANNPTFLNEAGVYDEGLVANYLASIRGNADAERQWETFIRNTRRNILEQAYMNMVRGGLSATLSEGEQLYHFENDKINIEYVQIPYTSIADEDVPVSDAEIDQYVSENSEEFEIDPQVDIQYVIFNNDPSAQDNIDMKETVAALINEANDGVETLPGFRDDTNHVAFLNRFSDIQFNDNWLFKDKLPVAVADSIYDLEVGEVYGPYELAGSYNLAKVVETKNLPDSAKARHILIRYSGATGAAGDAPAKEDAQTLADSIARVLRGDRDKFAELAAQFSDDNQNKNNGGDLGWFFPGMMVETFNDFIFDGSQGKLGTVETMFGIHVVEVEELSDAEKAVKVATLSKQIEPSDATLNEIFSKAVGVELEVAKRDFKEVAQEQGLAVRPVNEINELDSNIPGIGENRSIVTWAFNDETGVGDTKRFEIPGGGYIIAQLTRRSPKGLMSAADASANVAPILRNQKKAAKIREGITGTTLEDVAASQSVTVKNATALTLAAPTIAGAATEPEVVGAAFGKAAGETTGLIDGNSGVFMVRVLAVNKAEPLDNYEGFAEQAKNKVLPAINSSVNNALKKKADIDDNRTDIF